MFNWFYSVILQKNLNYIKSRLQIYLILHHVKVCRWNNFLLFYFVNKLYRFCNGVFALRFYLNNITNFLILYNMVNFTKTGFIAMFNQTIAFFPQIICGFHFRKSALIIHFLAYHVFKNVCLCISLGPYSSSIL